MEKKGEWIGSGTTKTGSNIGRRNKNCLICKRIVDDLLFCNKCKEKDIFTRMTALSKSKYWKASKKKLKLKEKK